MPLTAYATIPGVCRGLAAGTCQEAHDRAGPPVSTRDAPNFGMSASLGYSGRPPGTGSPFGRLDN